MNFITTYCRIAENSVCVNGKILLQNEHSGSWMKTIYGFLQLDYPKFFKMDTLCKLAIAGVEILKSNNQNLKNYPDDRIALVFANKNSSADTDLKFRQSYSEGGSPSPALFVYTLPNILIGEVAIKNKWYGENLFAVSPVFNPVFFENYCNMMISEKAEACICGWINVLDDEIEAFLFVVETQPGKTFNLPLTADNLLNLHFNNGVIPISSSRFFSKKRDSLRWGNGY